MNLRAVLVPGAALVPLLLGACHARSPLTAGPELAASGKPAASSEPAAAASDAGAPGCATPYAAGPTPIPGSSFPGRLGDVLVADMDHDGNQDIVFADGNDASEGDVHVLFGPFDSGRPAATWSSNARNYYRRLAVGDIDHDGYPDIAVAVQPARSGASLDCDGPDAQAAYSPATVSTRKAPPFFSPNLDCDGGSIGGTSTTGVNAWLGAWGGGSAPLAVAVFHNHGRGAPRDFGQVPSQTFAYQLPKDAGAAVSRALADAPLGALSVDLGDYNGDGYLDLAVGGGSFASGYSVPVQVLENDGHGVLQGGPMGWQSQDQPIAFSVKFLDWNGDGLVDLLATTQFGRQWGLLYLGIPGATAGKANLSTAATSGAFSYPLHCAIGGASDVLPGSSAGTIAAGAVNAKTATQSGALADPGALVQESGGVLAVPVTPPLAATVHFADLDGDGRPDLIVPAWTPNDSPEGAGPGPIFCEGDVLDGGALQTFPGPSFFAQGVGVGDIDKRSRLTGSMAAAACDGGTARRFVVPLAEANLQDVIGVTLKGASLDAGQYAAPPGTRMVYVAGGFTCGAEPTVQYVYSRSLDVVVGNFSTCGAPLNVFYAH